MAEDVWITAVAQELMMPPRSVSLIVRATQRAGAPIRPADLMAAGTLSRDGSDLLYPPASLCAPVASPAPPEATQTGGPGSRATTKGPEQPPAVAPGQQPRRPWSRRREH